MRFETTFPRVVAGAAVLLALALIAPTFAVTPPTPSPSVQLTTPKLAVTPTPYQSLGPAITAEPTPVPTPTEIAYPVPPDRITSTCKPEPAPSTDAQIWLAAKLSPREYCFVWWVIQHESSWRVALQRDPANDSACGLPQAYYCSKMSQCVGYLNSARWPGCIPVPDWQTNWKAQLRWMEWWVFVVMAPDSRHPSYSNGGTRYGSFAEVACFEFGCRTSDGQLHDSNGYY